MAESSWTNLKINVDPLAALRPPLKSILSVLEAIESVLEALLALLKAFMLDLLNPIRALIALLLAAIRAILNQIKSTGFAVLLVRPDFRRSDLRGVFNSVSGGYQAFESKVMGKFYDEADPFRPQYTAGMNAVMVIFYIGAESPGDLMSEIMALLDLLKHPMDDVGVAAPVGLKVSAPSQSGDPASQFWKLFQPSDANKSLVLEWKMPTSAAGIASPTLVGQIASSLPSYNLGQKFLIERTTDENPAGEPVYAKLESKTQGARVKKTIQKYNVPSASTKVAVKERNGGRYRFFPVRKKADNSTYLGGLTGTYRYIDTQLEEGKAYRYRVRAYLGTLDDAYVDPSIKTVDDAAKKLIKQDATNGWIVNFGKKVVMGKPSAVVRGYVPPQVSAGEIFDMYTDLMNASLAAILLNFELPFPSATDNATVLEQKTGWGTLSALAGPIGWQKIGHAKASVFVKQPFVKPTIRRVVNPVLEKLRKQAQLIKRLSKMWSSGVKETVEKILGQVGYTFSNSGTTPPVAYDWGLFGLIGDVTDAKQKQINAYLAKEDPDYSAKPKLYAGPLPVKAGLGAVYVTVQERSDLADFLRLAMSVNDQSANYLQWYSITIGDLFPALVPFLFDFEQWIIQLLKAVESALKEIADIINTLIQRVRDLEQLVKAIIALLEMLNIDLTVSALSVSGSNGVDDLVQGLLTSQNKPGDKPFGLHAGYVFTAGGPGPGFTKALEALKFLVTGGKLK